MIDVDQVMREVQDNPNSASSGDDPPMKIYYGQQAICIALMALLEEVVGLRQDLAEKN